MVAKYLTYLIGRVGKIAMRKMKKDRRELEIRNAKDKAHVKLIELIHPMVSQVLSGMLMELKEEH